MDLPGELAGALNRERTAQHLDQLVAEKVMGWRKPTRPYQPWDKRPDLPGVMLCRQHELPHFSTDIAAAWQVIRKLRERYTVDIGVEHSVTRVRVSKGDRSDMLPGAVRDLARSEARTAPIAICMAALDAVQADETPASQRDVTDNGAGVHELLERVRHALSSERDGRARHNHRIE